ncbi:hypothetical protein BGW38_010743 [Lunasporangiospora selenospora]|uniref:AAA+ ATPase domain-containing protein n=1 Tax=Lunasporangiospora selenospora TaxID=979761 RepID=A0A9P6KEQ0_9FUNG|nr:hypothetical protein BGW38_010743 [Lunasporangiospora selenospora]
MLFAVAQKVVVVALDEHDATTVAASALTVSNWIEPTDSTSKGDDPTRFKPRSRFPIESNLKRQLEGQVVFKDCVFRAKVRGKYQQFQVQELDIEESLKEQAKDTDISLEQRLAVVNEHSVVALRLPPVLPISSGRNGVTWKDVPGMSQLADEICRQVVDSFGHSVAYKRLGIPNKKAVIVTGVAGSGKKQLIHSCCRSLGLRVFQLSLAKTLANRDIMESDQASGLSHIRTVFDMALKSTPSAIVIPDLDVLAKDRGLDSSSQSSAISILCKEIECSRAFEQVFVFGLSRNRSKLPEKLAKQDIFQHEFHIPVPIKTQRQEILRHYISRYSPSSSVGSEEYPDPIRAAELTSGYVAKDLRNMCRSALLKSLRELHRQQKDNQINVDNGSGPTSSTVSSTRSPGFTISWNNLQYAIENSKPSQQVEFESRFLRTNWNEIGGYGEIKRRVQNAVRWPVSHPETFERMGVRPPMGLLLYGPSGCGKTMMVQALASESSMNFIPVKGPEIFSKYLGETEAKLRRLFMVARQIAPCILFFDEMDSIGAKRGWNGQGGDGSSSSGVSERVLSTLLNEMDGVEERSGVFVIGCTNQPGMVDDALLRPGRLDQLVYIGYPTTQDRLEIIETIGKRVPIPSEKDICMNLAHKTVGFSPADLAALFREAAILALRRDIHSTIVQIEDIEQVLHSMESNIKDRTAVDLGTGETIVCVPEIFKIFQNDR